MAAYEEALQRLYRSPIAAFVAERKRLAAEVRAKGDEAGAARIASRPKPVTSVWAVNQLYWLARDAYVEMLEAAARLRRGDRSAANAYRDSLANLRKRAATVLKEGGYAANDATLRRIATTLAAIAAAGGFDPDPPGALAADRDPPGFDAAGITAPPRPARSEQAHSVKAHRDSDGDATARKREQQKAELRAAKEAERKRREAERARQAEHSRLQAALRAATSELRTRERAHASLEKQLREADQALAAARENLKDLEHQLADLEQDE
jgi:hypothetical protein